MKKSLILLMCALVVFSLFAACGMKNDDNMNDNKPGNVDKPDDKNNIGDNIGDGINDIGNGVGDMASGMTAAASDVWDGLMEMFGDKSPKTAEGTDEIFARDYGLDEELFDSYTLRTPEGENNAQEFFIAKVKEGKMSDVEAALEKRKVAIADQWASSTDAGMAYAKQPVIIKNGNYIMLAVHDDLDRARAEFERLTTETN